MKALRKFALLVPLVAIFTLLTSSYAETTYLPRGIKSVQRGTIAFGGATSNTATITAVVTANSILHLLGFETEGDVSDLGMARVALTNTTTVTANVGSGVTGTVSFEVAEYFSGIIRSVQRGTLTCASTNTATVTAVTTGKSVLTILGMTSNVSSDFRDQTRLALTNSTTITCNTKASTTGNGGTTTIGYQLAEFR